MRALTSVLLSLLAALAACESGSGARCAADFDCATGICDEGACVTLACEQRGDCPSGTCGLDGQCRAVECDPERACAEGFACIDGLCRSPRSEGREVGVEVWDSVVPPSPLPPDAFRADAAPMVVDMARAPVDAPVKDAAPREDASAAGDAPSDAVTDAGADAGSLADAHALLAAFFALTFGFDHGDCQLQDPATPKDLWIEEAADGNLTGRLTAPGGGSGLDLAGTRTGDAVSLATLVPLRVLPLCETMLDVRLDGVLDPSGTLNGLADWHTFTTAADCPAPTDCHRFDRFDSAPVAVP